MRREKIKFYLAMESAIKEKREGMLIVVKGVVQGVGFRPFVYNLAHHWGIMGRVSNSTQGVIVEAEGTQESLQGFIQDLRAKAPPLSQLEEIEILPGRWKSFQDFHIRKSVSARKEPTLISPDVATCEDCLQDIRDPANRRYRYPFTNCTNCGPRFSIVQGIPYDRPRTTMKDFKMCPQCEAEYKHPSNRRFHSQPNACPQCGPHLTLFNQKGRKVPTPDPVQKAIELLKKGNILAIKGLGGFHLTCDATEDEPVGRLRERKGRPAKPLAVMVPDIETVRKICITNLDEEDILDSPQSPILLLRKSRRPGLDVSELVAPKNPYLGVMLPYTPLHHLLFEGEKLKALVMTSGNPKGEPIIADQREAIERLDSVADYFLVHNRVIWNRNDDSVAFSIGGRPSFIRRSRGWVPSPVNIPISTEPVLACGGFYKNTFCLAKGRRAFLSQHIGELDNLETLEFFKETLGRFKAWLDIEPQVIAYDLHPDYLSTRFAQGLTAGIKVGVQHHHAHLASCAAENGWRGRALGVAFDGSGYGLDGTIWGGEFFLFDLKGFQRVAHLRPFPLPGGDLSIRRPHRAALGYLLGFWGKDALRLPLKMWHEFKEGEPEVVAKQVEKGINCPFTSSVGRLFDICSALLGRCFCNTYEGRAAVELESLAQGGDVQGIYPFRIREEGGKLVLEHQGIVAGVIDDILKGRGEGEIAFRFHRSLVELIIQTCERLGQRWGEKMVFLSGGVFQNRYLLSETIDELRERGFKPFYHRQVPANDGGISLGQAVVAGGKIKQDVFGNSRKN